MTFKQKVQSLTASEIIMAMVTALKHPPIINIDMGTYGAIKTVRYGLFKLRKKHVCFGCAATNTVCQISGVVFTADNIKNTSKRTLAVNGFYDYSANNFLGDFENAINALRTGDVYGYNVIARRAKFAEIRIHWPPQMSLPKLEDSYTDQDLLPYIQLAQAQIK